MWNWKVEEKVQGTTGTPKATKGRRKMVATIEKKQNEEPLVMAIVQ